jgi:multidrug efflux system membrane fusion protein
MASENNSENPQTPLLLPPPESSHSEASSPPHQRSRLLLFSLIGIALVVGFFLIRDLTESKKNQAGTAKPATAEVPIKTATVRKGDIGNYIEALGTVTPLKTVTVYSRIQGQIMSVNYTEGQSLKVGDSLIEIDARPYEAALLQAQGALERDRALLQEARIDLQRYRKAWAQRAIQKQLLDDQEQIVLQDAGTVRSDEGTLENAQANLDYCHIHSPIDGRIGLRLVDPGNMVQANSTTGLAVITQLQPITVIFSVAEDFLPQIQEGLRALGPGASMKVDALDRNQKKQIATGSFLTLDNEVDTTTGTVRVRAVFDNKDGALFPNQFVNARLLVSTDRGATLVATPAIQRGSKGSFVYVVDANKTAQMRAVKVGITEGETSEVEGLI